MKPPPFERFLQSHRDAVFRFLTALVGPQEAEDCWQETFLAALEAYPRLYAGNSSAWIMTIARNKATDAHRRQGRSPLPVESVPDQPVGAAPPPDHELWATARSLPAKQAEALALRYAGDLAYSEVAAAMGCSEDAARQSVRQGLKKLREVVEP